MIDSFAALDDFKTAKADFVSFLEAIFGIKTGGILTQFGCLFWGFWFVRESERGFQKCLEKRQNPKGMS